MAEKTNGDGADQAPVLDLRELARPRQRVRTSVGDFLLRRVSELGAIERSQANAALEQAQRVAGEVERGEFSGTTRDAAEELAMHENVVLSIALVGVSEEQLAQMPEPERGGVLAAFYGASEEGARQAVEAVMEAMLAPATPQGRAKPKRRRSTGANLSRASSASTAATRQAG